MPIRRPALHATFWRLALLAVLALGVVLPAPPAAAQAGCTELIANGGFESDGSWLFGLDPVQPQYVTNPVHNGARSLQLGIPSGAATQRSYSSARQQITIPADAGQAILSFWYLANMPGVPGADYVEMSLLAPDGHSLLDKPWRSFVDNRAWSAAAFDLSAWRGITLQVYFNIYNSATDPNAVVYLDDVSLLSCPGGSSLPTATPTGTLTSEPPPGSATPTPTATTGSAPTNTPTTEPPPGSATPTATATPTPTGTLTATPTGTLTPTEIPPYVPPAVPGGPAGPPPVVGAPAADCVDMVVNGDFDQGFYGWELAPNKLPVLLLQPPSIGFSTVRLGTQETAGVESYSSIRQPVNIPAGSGEVLLQFWSWTWSETLAGRSHEEADFLALDNAVLRKFWRTLRNDQAWVFNSIPVTAYRGRQVMLYFNVYNDGVSGRSAMFLDGVHIWACPGVYLSALMGYAGTVVTLTPTEEPEPVVPAATDTPVPPVAVAAAPPAEVAPAMTVLSLAVTPTPTAPPVAVAPLGATGGANLVLVTVTPTPSPGIFDRIGLKLPPLPRYWWLGLLLIIGVIALIIAVRRAGTGGP